MIGVYIYAHVFHTYFACVRFVGPDMMFRVISHVLVLDLLMCFVLCALLVLLWCCFVCDICVVVVLVCESSWLCLWRGCETT